jgi:hypothetical protein
MAAGVCHAGLVAYAADAGFLGLATAADAGGGVVAVIWGY